jgi:hypothetical protein
MANPTFSGKIVNSQSRRNIPQRYPSGLKESYVGRASAARDLPGDYAAKLGD